MMITGGMSTGPFLGCSVPTTEGPRGSPPIGSRLQLFERPPGAVVRGWPCGGDRVWQVLARFGSEIGRRRHEWLHQLGLGDRLTDVRQLAESDRHTGLRVWPPFPLLIGVSRPPP